MTASALSKILQAYKEKPAGPVPNAKDWEIIEKAIGRPIPLDYKTIIECTGGCSLGRCFLRNPAVHDNIYVALSHAALNREHILMGEMALEDLRIALYPDPGGWVQLARKDQVYFMLKPEGENIAIADFSGWEVIEPGMNFAELMWEMFNDRELFDGLGSSIWHNSDQLFGLH